MTLSLGPAKGKDFDNSNIMGPCLVTPDEISDPYNLRMTAKINGEVWADGNTSDMYYSFAEMISFVSQSETLHPWRIFRVRHRRKWVWMGTRPLDPTR